MDLSDSKMCPRCQAGRLKDWKELGADDKFLAEKLPASAENDLEARKKHRFCTRCWYEDRGETPKIA